MPEHIKPTNVWESELLEAYRSQLDRTMDAGKQGDVEGFRQSLADLDTIRRVARRFNVALGILAWNDSEASGG